MEIILQGSSIEELQNSQSPVSILPAGSEIQIDISVPWWGLVLEANTLPSLLGTYDIDRTLSDAGIQVTYKSPVSWRDTTATIKGVCTRDVSVSDISFTPGVNEAGVGGVLKWVVVGLIALAGTGAVIKVSADWRHVSTEKINLTRELSGQGYTPEQIAKIFQGISTSPIGVDVSSLTGWAVPAALGVAGVFILSGLFKK